MDKLTVRYHPDRFTKPEFAGDTITTGVQTVFEQIGPDRWLRVNLRQLEKTWSQGFARQPGTVVIDSAHIVGRKEASGHQPMQALDPARIALLADSAASNTAAPSFEAHMSDAARAALGSLSHVPAAAKR